MRPPQFDSHADDYEAQCASGLAVSGEPKEFFARGRLEMLRARWDRAGRTEPARVLDYGCGVGDVTALLAETFPRAQVLGLDPSERCVARARARFTGPRVSFETLADETEIAPCDLVHLNGVVHHVPPAERKRLFAHLAGLLAPAGVLVVFENNPWNPGARLVMSRIAFDRDAVPISAPALRGLVRGAGLRVCETRSLFWFPRPLAALRPLERFLVRVPFGAQYAVIAQRTASPRAAAEAQPPRARP